jgi:RimJ/RimL family protein N-acetyltransferase
MIGSHGGREHQNRQALLKHMTDADLDWLARLHGDPRVMRYIDDGKPVPRAVVVRQTLPAILREYDEHPDGLGYFAAVERATGRPLGWIGLGPPNSTGLRPPNSTGLRPPNSTGLRPPNSTGLRPPNSTGLGMTRLDSAAGAAELGYRLLPEAWRLGYATEGARALVRHGFTVLDVEQVVATTMTLNAASRRVLEKTGLSLVRTFLAAWPSYIEGAGHGEVVYGVARQAWLA